ncbi:MAG: M48 family metallopeptidase [Dehalococcoidia bacterium]|nr:M48 family metallopeptidase [Dehalococcoidia bacterium]
MRRAQPSDSSNETTRALERHEHGMVAAGGIVVPYRIVRSARRRRTLELRMEADGVRVAVPLRTPLHEIDAFVRSRVEWIKKHRTARPRPSAPGFVTGDVLPYLGGRMPLEVVEGGPTAGRRPRVQADLLGLRVTLPRPARAEDAEDGTSEPVQDALRRWYRDRAVEVLTDRVEAWAAKAGYGPGRVLVRDQKRRWGSCAKDGTLRFNWRLVMLDPSVIDYVVVHEIAHLVRPHHRPTFWAEVERLLPDYRARRKALAEQGSGLPL